MLSLTNWTEDKAQTGNRCATFCADAVSLGIDPDDAIPASIVESWIVRIRERME
jgi:hypothetical protein